jgi:hypothetical protein
MQRNRNRGVWLAWLGAIWLFAIFLASIVSYSRGIDVVALLVALLGQLTLAIAWLLWRPLPLWIVSGWGLIMLSAVLGLLITVPGGFFVSWLMVGIVPVGLAMLVAALIEMERSPELSH